MSLDNHIQGDFDPNAPFNQLYETDNRIESISDALLELDSETLLKIDQKAIDLISEVRKEIQSLREYAKQNENVYLLKRLNSIYNKL